MSNKNSNENNVKNNVENNVSNNTVEYIKEVLGATVIATSMIPQKDKADILMEQCVIDGKYKFVIISSNDNGNNTTDTVIVC